MYGVDVWFEQVKSRVGPKMKQDQLQFCWSWRPGEISEMADRRDWGGGGDDLEESTQRMIERIWESLTDIRARMDQQAPIPPVAVPPGDEEAIPVAPVPPRVETVEEAAQRAATLERSIRTRQVGESGSGSFRLPQQTVGASKGKAPAGPSSSGFGKWGQKLKQAFKGKGRGWGGRQQLQQGRGRPEVEESQQSTARQPIVHPGYRCYNCNQPGHLIRNCPYAREYGYGRGVQQQQQPQQFQQPQAGGSGRRRGSTLTVATTTSSTAAVGGRDLLGGDDVDDGGRSRQRPQAAASSSTTPAATTATGGKGEGKVGVGSTGGKGWSRGKIGRQRPILRPTLVSSQNWSLKCDRQYPSLVGRL
ncbi:hypothetical protein Taro_015408 [Colocasia esculenta]|uniref:CCHC-type domain-containing protein n=1 Tax=Colocasia esculenta TaxID=4460 RepID=A0A843UM84_COLES|nr:hypothetical protein [Colocasia esculenta]